MTFFEATRVIGAGYPPYEKFKSTGRFVTRELTGVQIARIVHTLRSYPKGSVFTGYSLYALGGATARPRRNDTAFFYREARYIALLQSVWEEKEYEKLNIAWVDRNFPYLAFLTAGSYVNFPYSGLVDYMRAYYGGHSPRLRRIKRLYDPYNVFRFPQSVR
jgi:FAD/FMN-containing dehydrogenase